MKILLTGSKGYLGSHLLSLLKKKSYSVFELDKRLEELKPNTIEADIVIHLAACLEKNREGIIRTNIVNQQCLLDALKKNAKIIFLSSRRVYSYCQNDSKKPYTEESVNLGVRDIYAFSKIMGEELIINSKHQYIILRSSVIYGKNNRENIGTNFINKMISFAKENGVININSKKYLVDPIHVDDVSKIILHCINDCKDWNNIYNINGTCHSILDIGQFIYTHTLKYNQKLEMVIKEEKVTSEIIDSIKIRRLLFEYPNKVIFPEITKIIKNIYKDE